MEGYVKPGLLLLSICLLIFIVFILIENWIRKRREEKSQGMAFHINTNTEDAPDVMRSKENISLSESSRKDLLVLSVMAKSGRRFGSYDLLQIISGVGLQFGDMNIFHYYSNTPQIEAGTPLFSLVSAEEPGDFQLDQFGNFSCSGLMLFMNMKSVSNPRAVFHQMLMTAERLTEDLDGELRADPKTPWTKGVSDYYLRKLDSV